MIHEHANHDHDHAEHDAAKADTRDDAIKRLSYIEGHLAGVKKMVEVIEPASRPIIGCTIIYGFLELLGSCVAGAGGGAGPGGGGGFGGSGPVFVPDPSGERFCFPPR